MLSTHNPEASSSENIAPVAAQEDNLAHSQHRMITRWRASSGNVTANEIELLPGNELTSTEKNALSDYYTRFNRKEFILYQSEGLPTLITHNAYNVEQQSFMKECVVIPRSNVPKGYNIIRSHVLYKIKLRVDGTLTCKARIAPHGNEDKEKHNLKTYSASCPPLGIRMLYSLSVIHSWYLTKLDVKNVFLQSGPATRDVYVILPSESEHEGFVWLLTVATYGLVNANAKWQKHSDDTFLDL